MITQPTNPMLRPTFRVAIGGTDYTARILPHLVKLSIKSSRQDHADTVTLEFADSDGDLALPRRGVELEAMLGFENAGVCLQGTYHVDEVGYRGTPDTITVTARSAKLSSALRTRKERSWNTTTVGHVVSVIAGEHQLTPRIAPALAGLPVEHLAQTESDIALLRRLGHMWDAVATVKAGKLLFMPIGATQTASGKPLDRLIIVRGDGDQHDFNAADGDVYTGIRARWHDVSDARGKTYLAGKAGHVRFLKGDFASKEDATRAAEAEFARVKRGASKFSLTLAIGRPDIYPELPVTARGWKPDIEAVDWIIKEATHSLEPGTGYVTQLELESKATASDSAAVDESEDDA